MDNSEIIPMEKSQKFYLLLFSFATAKGFFPPFSRVECRGYPRGVGRYPSECVQRHSPDLFVQRGLLLGKVGTKLGVEDRFLASQMIITDLEKKISGPSRGDREIAMAKKKKNVFLSLCFGKNHKTFSLSLLALLTCQLSAISYIYFSNVKIRRRFLLFR